MRTYLIVALLATVGCAKSVSSERQGSGGSGSGPVPVSTVLTDAVPNAADAAPSCDGEPREHLAKSRAEAQRAFQAMNGAGAMRVARAEWAAVIAPCRDARWYFVAALMIAFVPEAIEAGTARIETEEAALTAGLARPADIELLARVAYVSALGRKPVLPADACARAKALAVASNDPDAVAYTCAQAALVAADGLAAARLLAAIKEPKRWLDTELAQARAAKLANDKAAMARFAQAATKVGYERAQMANVAADDAKIVVQAAKQLLAGKR